MTIGLQNTPIRVDDLRCLKGPFVESYHATAQDADRAMDYSTRCDDPGVIYGDLKLRHYLEPPSALVSLVV